MFEKTDQDVQASGPCVHAQPMELGPSGECSRERGDASGDSTCTGDAKAAKASARGQGQQPEEGDSVSGAELLTAVDPKLSISDTSVLKCARALPCTYSLYNPDFWLLATACRYISMPLTVCLGACAFMSLSYLHALAWAALRLPEAALMALCNPQDDGQLWGGSGLPCQHTRPGYRLVTGPAGAPGRSAWGQSFSCNIRLPNF